MATKHQNIVPYHSFRIRLIGVEMIQRYLIQFRPMVIAIVKLL